MRNKIISDLLAFGFGMYYIRCAMIGTFLGEIINDVDNGWKSGNWNLLPDTNAENSLCCPWETYRKWLKKE
jgi:hypothetical protein